MSIDKIAAILSKGVMGENSNTFGRILAFFPDTDETKTLTLGQLKKALIKVSLIQERAITKFCEID